MIVVGDVRCGFEKFYPWMGADFLGFEFECGVSYFAELSYQRGHEKESFYNYVECHD